VTGGGSLNTTAAYTIENTGTVPLTLNQLPSTVVSTSGSGTISINGKLQNPGVIGTVLQAGDTTSANVLWAATCTSPVTAVIALTARQSSSLGAQTCSINVQFGCT
jgi:hypothetical protein